jgi:surface carbohydrate biosynthesis protein
MRIGIVVDHPKRDLAGCVRIAYELARRGREAILLPHYEQGLEAPLLGLHAVLLNNARPHYLALAEGYRSSGTMVCVLDTEGGVLGEKGFNAPARIAQRFRDSGIGRLVDLYLFWGERLRDAFVEHSGLPAERLRITGCPRYDLCHPTWRKTLAYPRRGFVLINTNFNAVNPLFASGKDADRQPLRSQGVTDSEIESRYRAARAVFDRLVPELVALARRSPERAFVLRPHPFERSDYYREAFADCANVVLDDTGDVMAVLSAAQCMLHVNCGTSVEATFLGVLPIAVEFANNDAARGLNPLPARISHPAQSADELDDALSRSAEISRRHPFQAHYQAQIHPWFYDNDGQAGGRVAEALAQAVEGGGRMRTRKSLGLSLMSGQKPPRASQLAQGALAQLLGSRATRAMREALDPGRRHKRFDLVQVQGLLDRMALADPVPVQASASALRNPYSGHRLLSVGVGRRS